MEQLLVGMGFIVRTGFLTGVRFFSSPVLGVEKDDIFIIVNPKFHCMIYASRDSCIFYTRPPLSHLYSVRRVKNLRENGRRENLSFNT